MKVLRFIVLLLVSISYFLISVPSVHASWVPPQPPFSLEGNPPEDYFYGDIFSLFKYIRPPALEIYENDERSRNYEDLEVCGGEGGKENPYDHRDYLCDNVGDTCDGGDVELCHRGTTDVARSGNSRPNNSCTVKAITENHPAGTQGTCRYTQKPSTHKDIKGTDFSNASQVIYQKIQSKSGAYNNVGTDNAITWGSQHLSSKFDQKIINQLLVVKRAKQTKNTVKETGEWPLGWVDWGYKDNHMKKSLLEVEMALPDNVSAAGSTILEGADDFFLNAGNLEAVSNTESNKAYVVEEVKKALNQNPPEEWALDLTSVPMYSPSWRQSYVRPSICVWAICCPGLRCIVIPPPTGIKRALYYDNSISQAFGAALDNLLTIYPLDEGVAIFNKLAIKNPLIRFATSASQNAIPSKIVERLDKEIQDPCYKYVKGMYWLWFGTFMDYVKPGDFFDKERKCPVWQIAPDEISKENANAYFQSPVSALIALLWQKVQDNVDSVVFHTLTIPEAMGQSIQEIQQPVYDARDTLAELEAIQDFNSNLSNTVDDGQDGLFSGENPFEHRRKLPFYACDDSMFSSQMDTSIQAYALGTRIGCDGKSSPTTAGKCDGSKFAAIIADSPWKAPLTTATSIVLNSEMFVGGKLNPELEDVYAKVEKETGVPCEVLAGIHFEEASEYFTEAGKPGPETRSAANGGPANEEGGFEATVLTAARALLRHPIPNTERLVTAISNFNGGGNANCQKIKGVTIPYKGCPREFIGEDDPYATHMIDSKHTTMYQIYCADFKVCSPLPVYDKERPGAFAVALAVYNEATSKNTPPSDTTTPPAASPKPVGPISTGSSLNPAGDCGTGYIDTALGCLPYERTEFIMALLRFLTGISGAIALAVMLIGTIQIMTAGGDAKKIQSGKELFMAGITGLLFLIFSVSLVRIIAGNILKIPGF